MDPAISDPYRQPSEQPSGPGRGSDTSDSPVATPTKRTLACERCWRRKHKCDRLLPACTRCAKLGLECVARSQQATFTQGDVGLTHATVNGYIDSLKQRVADLEHTLQVAEQQQTRAARDLSGSVTALSPPQGGPIHSIDAVAATAPSTGLGPLPDDEDLSVQDTMSAIGLLSNKAMAESRAYSSDVPHKLAMSEMILAALAIDGQDPSVASLSRPAFVIEDHLLSLDRDSTISYVRQFLDWSVFLPHIVEDRLLELYEAVVGPHSQAGHATIPGLPRFNAYLAVAIGIMMSPEANRLSTLALSLHAAAVKLLPIVLRSQEPLDLLHCMLLLVVFSIFSPAGGSTWHLMGVAMTTCIASGIHKDHALQSRLGVDSIYRTNWMFWSIYLLDRSLACTMGRPFSIQDEDISITVPKEGDSDNSPTSNATRMRLAFSKHLVVHAQLISDMRSNRRTEPLFSYTNLSFWREHTPRMVSVTGAAKLPLEYLDQLACRALILMINPGTPVDPNPRAFADNYFDVEADTMKSCKRFIEQLYNRSGRGMIVGSLIDAYDVLSASVVYICLFWRSGDTHQQGLAQIFEMVSKASTLLTQFSSRFSALAAFPPFLLSLLTKGMREQNSEGQQEFQETIPANLPTHLRRLLKEKYTGGVRQ
ncbi:hypothetical protein B0J13DRAFT_535033 [Dactylonectria estremocensis]|uniref:Zn(2)-C6 fungal-type domain-containing protein n=1 Tax=Dactylonectria estremocensis TaxID=1079267 RepID=A0A9P9FFU6_9HYPO|nr:hypothetical protein B0J13DRAFT_535033 [Dactylonectria estremocensis]